MQTLDNGHLIEEEIKSPKVRMSFLANFNSQREIDKSFFIPLSLT